MTDARDYQDRIKGYRRREWRRLDKWQRSFLRDEYRHVRRNGLPRVIAQGSLNRVANEIGLANRRPAVRDE
jgi:hypothetical protein